MIEKLPNNRIRVTDDGTHSIEILSLRSKLNEVIEAVNVHEVTLYGLDDDTDDEPYDGSKRKSEPLLGEFVDYCITHPELRFWQALRNWSGYSKIYGETHGYADRIEDTYYKTTKGPNQ